MPSDKKRVNLTIPDEIYERLQRYKARIGATNDAGVCLQLIVQQLNACDTSDALVKVVQSMTMEQLAQLSLDGMATVKETLPSNPESR